TSALPDAWPWASVALIVHTAGTVAATKVPASLPWLSVTAAAGTTVGVQPAPATVKATGSFATGAPFLSLTVATTCALWPVDRLCGLTDTDTVTPVEEVSWMAT